jgi:hypothetical protein
MRTRYRQNPKTGKLELVGVVHDNPHAGTFQVGDLPDIQRDQERAKLDRQKKQKQERLQTIIETVNRYG